MPIKMKKTARIAVQMVIGKTKRNRTAHRTTYIRDVPVGLTDAEVLALVERHRPNFPYPIISKIRYQIIEDNIVWLDEENTQKMERRRVRLEKRAAREAKRAAQEAEKNTPEQTLLDFPEEIEETIEELTVETTSASIAPQPEEEKAEKKERKNFLVSTVKAIASQFKLTRSESSEVTITREKTIEEANAQTAPDLPEEAGGAISAVAKPEKFDIDEHQKQLRRESAQYETILPATVPKEEEYIVRELGFPSGQEKKFKAILTGLVGDAPDGSDVDISYEQLVGAGYPVDFLKSRGMKPGMSLRVHVVYEYVDKKKNDAKQDKKNAAKEFKKEKGKRKQAAQSSKRNRKKK